MPKTRKRPQPKIAETLILAVQKALAADGNGNLDLGNWMAPVNEKVESIVQMMRQIDQQIKTLADQIDELHRQLEQRFDVEAQLRDHLTRIVETEGDIRIGRIRVALVEKVEVKVHDRERLPNDLVEKETTTSIVPLIDKIKRRLHAGKKVAGAELRTVRHLKIQGS